MAAHAGERAEKTGDFHCAKCNAKVHVSKGDKIPKCAECGSTEYATRTGEPGNKS
jgi:Zn finger protein HypA/HybF involved in hydrogenase expression